MYVPQLEEPLKRGLAWAICANGVFDVACSLPSMLAGYDNLPWALRWLADLHPGVLRRQEDRENALARRFACYWICTYGFVRISAFNGDPHVNLVAASTYFVESMAYAREEVFYSATVTPFSSWIVASCTVLGWAALVFSS